MIAPPTPPIMQTPHQRVSLCILDFCITFHRLTRLPALLAHLSSVSWLRVPRKMTVQCSVSLSVARWEKIGASTCIAAWDILLVVPLRFLPRRCAALLATPDLYSACRIGYTALRTPRFAPPDICVNWYDFSSLIVSNIFLHSSQQPLT